jgi:putative membrane-bound dehydrogenase-like protein
MHYPGMGRSWLLSVSSAAWLAFAAPQSSAEEPLPQVERLKTSPVLQTLKPNPLLAPPRTAAEKTVAQMYVPAGFRAELVVAEPDLHQPVAFTFDERGRMWVAEAYSYPTKRPPGQGLDKIVIFEDGDGDGRFETRKEFADRLNLVSGLEVGCGGVWVGAAPQLLFIPDRNHDDVPDGLPEVLLDGFGYQDTHECLNSFLWGPDGWLYGNQGVFNYARIGKPGTPDDKRIELRAGVWRYHPVRHQFEVFAAGGSNQWGLDYDDRGQLFMTHCRSYWGRGLTTHVIQGAHYWNQANANYAPFIVATPPADFPEFRNFMLASARYDHGAGGAGKPGSDAIYGGHSHVGTMIYLGDNWPDAFRGHLFTHNLHGHQINHQVNERLGSGFNTVHGGQDIFFCTDPKYVAVDLQYGPDGAVYVIDWYDQQHCHNPNTERWDRGNGRIYRLQYEPTYQPHKVDLGSLNNDRLVGLMTRKNEWYGRTAQRLLQERAAAGQHIERSALRALRQLARAGATTSQRLRGMWALHAIGEFSERDAWDALGDADEYVRAWTIQLSTDDRKVSTGLQKAFVAMAESDPSAVVRLYLASAIQRVPRDTAWELIEALASRGEDVEDRNLPSMIWYGLAPQMSGHLEQAFALARNTRLPRLADNIHWFAATLEGEGLNMAVGRLRETTSDYLRRRLAGLDLAMKSRANARMPSAWPEIAPRLYANPDVRVVRQAERLAAVFGDESMFPRLRAQLADAKAEMSGRQHAFAVLSRAQDRQSLSTFVRLVDDPAFRTQAVALIARFDSPEVSAVLLRNIESFGPNDRAAALNALTSRPSYALALLDAVAAGKVKREHLTAYHVRQMTELKNPEVDKRVVAAWGRLQKSPAEKLAAIDRLEKVFNEAPLWAYSANEGRKHFQKLCISCHKLQGEGTMLGPDLTGASRNGIRYFLENVIDPNAVIGTDFQMTTVETKQGDVVSGLLTAETPTAITFRTTVGETIVAKADIVSRSTSERSLMPEGLLESLNDREQIELLKFLSGK